MDSKETPKGLGRRAPLTHSALTCLSKFLPELFSNLTFLCLYGTFLRCHLKANPGHQIPLSNQEDRCVIPRPACLLTHRGLCYANQDMSTPEFLLLSPEARTAASCESVLKAFSEETEITLNTSQSLKYTCQEAMCNLIVWVDFNSNTFSFSNFPFTHLI